MIFASEDEFTGETLHIIRRHGEDGELVLAFLCDARGTGVAFQPGPEADWNVFQDGLVRFRFDGSEPVGPVTFVDRNTTLMISTLDGRGQALAERLLEAEIAMVQVSVFRSGYETDTFSMQGVAPLLEEGGCE